ncbi:MAG: diguanylate cyclase [Burkholderiales bacterium]|nr:diguanylate cyclase [Burkholderiales bacterium]
MTTENPPGSAHPADVDLLETFVAFPAPLALLDASGRTERVNAMFLQRFGADGVNAGRLGALIHDQRDGWHKLTLSLREGADAEVRARAVRASGHILLIIEQAGGVEQHSELDALRARIGELERLVATDHLTGAWNRAHLDRVIESERARSLANRQPLSLILFDADHFKKINDDYGHAVGDSVLRELVQLARKRIRASDLLFRWGGEEFVVLVSSAGYRGAERVAETLREAVAAHAFEGAGRVTVSLGVAEHDGDEDAQSWFRRMDEALYEAKRSGRNRVVVSRQGNSDAWAAAGGAGALHLAWQEGYECGDATIDGEHRELFRLANILIDAALPERIAPGAVRSALGGLLAHVQRHFADEEAILERLHYAQLPQHRQAHAGLLRRAQYMAEQLEAGKASLGAIVEFLAQDVVARHLMVVDRAFFPMFRQPAGPGDAGFAQSQAIGAGRPLA